MELCNETLDKLKCSECCEYLSCEPVYLKTNSDSVCGRCYIPDNSKIARNKAYEYLASEVLFPCRYEKDGCKTKLGLQDMKKHEEECLFLCYNCPVLPVGTCSWRGNRNCLMEHYTKHHPENVLDYPGEHKPNLRTNNDQNLLMVAFGFLFLVQIRCRTAFDSIWFNVRLLNNQAIKNIFEYKIEIGNGSDKIIKSRGVQSHKKLPLIQTISATCFSIKNILNDLRDHKKICMNVSLIIKETFCCVCKTLLNSAPIFVSNEGFTCETCSAANHKPCRNEDKGCNFRDNELNLNKHEKWLCKYSKSVCTKCRIKLTDSSLLEHDMEKHVNFKIEDNKMEFKNLFENQQYRSVLTANNIFAFKRQIKFYCIWKIGKESLDFDVISDLSKVENRKFRCKLVLTNPETDYCALEEDVKIVEQNDYYFDWDLTEKEGDFKKAIAYDSYNLSFSIENCD